MITGVFRIIAFFPRDRKTQQNKKALRKRAFYHVLLFYLVCCCCPGSCNFSARCVKNFSQNFFVNRLPVIPRSCPLARCSSSAGPFLLEFYKTQKLSEESFISFLYVHAKHLSPVSLFSVFLLRLS